MITFCDGLDYCEVYNHTSRIERDWYTIDIIGTMARDEICIKCGKKKSTTKSGSDLRMSETIYPKGVWA